MDPAQLPAHRDHLEEEDRLRLARFEFLIGENRFDEAQDIVEELWIEAIDAHRDLYKGLSNALTAVCARQADQRRGAAEIAHQSRFILQPYPRHVLGFDIDALLDSVSEYVARGDGSIRFLRPA